MTRFELTNKYLEVNAFSLVNENSLLYNLHALNEIYINQEEVMSIKTGIKANLEDDEILLITNYPDNPYTKDFVLLNTPLLIDKSYFDTHDEIELVAKNISMMFNNSHIAQGEPLAQCTVLVAKQPSKNKNNTVAPTQTVSSNKIKRGVAYCDGSYNSITRDYGYGVLLIADGEEHEFYDVGTDVAKASMRNVAGEIDGAMCAVNEAMKLGIDELTIYYDYEGVKKWCTHEWKAKNQWTQAYRDYMNDQNIKLSFVHVKGHSGNDGNERADALARKATGID